MTDPDHSSVSRRRHLLLLAAHYPPSGESGARRPYALVKNFRKRGWEVDVIVIAPNPGGPVAGAWGETIHYAVTEQSWLGALRHRIGAWLPSHLDRVRRHRRAVLRTALPLLTPHSIIYSTAPPAGTAVLGADLHSRCKLNPGLILEFRDPWTIMTRPIWKSLIMPSLLAERQRILGEADALVAVTNGIAASLRDLAPGTSPMVAMNGVPDDFRIVEESPPASQDRPIRILYLGEFYLARNPAPVLDALAGLIEDGRLSPGDFELSFVGDVENTRAGPLRNLLSSRGLEACASLEPRIPHEEARSRLEQADIFLLHAEHQPRQAPNKLFEYLAFRRPILAVADREGETAAILEATGHSSTLVDPGATDAQFRSAILSAFDMARKGRLAGDPKVIESLRSSHQLCGVVELADSLLRRRLPGQSDHRQPDIAE